MSCADRAVLRVGRARWYEDTRLLTAWGISTAFMPPDKEAANGENQGG